MDVASGFDHKYTNTFYILPHLDLNEFPDLGKPVRDKDAKTFGCFCFQSDPLSTYNVLPKRGFVPGERCQFTVELNNDSEIGIDEVSLKLTEYTTFYVREPTRRTKEHKRILWSKEFECPRGINKLVMALQNKVFSTELYFDPSDKFKVFQGCGIMDADYRIKSEARVYGCRTNLENRTAIIIGTVPIHAENSEHNNVPLAPMMPSAPLPDSPTAPLDVIEEQPLPSYNEVAFKPPIVLPPRGGNNFGWVVSPNAEQSNKDETRK